MIVKQLDKMNIKQATELYISVFSGEPWHDEYDSFEEVEQFIQNFMTSETYLNFVALENEEIIGLCLGMKKPWIKGIEYYIDEFCIKRERQGSGLGSTFLAKIENDISLLGMNGLILNTEASFESTNFYLKNGFHKLSDLIVLGK
ncbi:hypothetical protein A5821_001306 [Enterococcus sp. 7F3_DIV0205]|uniref:N-acetyltransferase domain-containing protein n=1 Tax=Candidatus Enterococcus palustris TaxID=1834189 RepID=A0AAQ3W7R4_9ENTE|nr:GNAT family N-acetyltransferase [Enterococcus sp. 7F3_DIV0205]OTN85704.1 hypothetical protein A5821_001650 [Enterococcus sp. 7F3_DIV0205]